MSEPVRTFGPRSEVEVDPDAELEVLGLAASTPLDELEAELTAPLDAPPVVLPIPARDGWEAVYTTELTADQLARWAKASASRQHPGGTDNLALCLRILANLNVGLRRGGEDLVVDGDPLTVRHRRFLELVHETRPVDAVRALYGRDGHAIAAAEAILAEAGFGDDVAGIAADPTVAG